MAGGEEGARASGDADEEQAAAASEEEESSALDSDHAARSGGSSSSSEDEDDEQPLAQRASSAAAARTPSKPASTRTRVNRFPKIKRSERCGRCENCLNPQRKKACIVARQRMEQRLNAHGGAAVSAVPTGAWRAAATAAPPTADDPFTRALTGILSSSGGVLQERHVPLLLRLVRRAASKAHRAALLVVLQLSAGEVLRGAVAGGLLLELQGWLGEYVAEGRQALVQKVLACLDKMPVTLAALQPPCELGKVVGRLRKHEAFGSAVVEPAKRLVARWKEVVERSAQTGGAASGASATSVPVKPPPAAPMPKLVAAPPPLDPQPSATLAVGEDGDLFKTTDKQRTGPKGAAPAVGKKVVTIKTIALEPTTDRAEAGPAAAPSPRGPVAVAAAGGKPATFAGAQTDVTRVSASPFSSLGGPGSGVTVLGGASASLAPLPTLGPPSHGAKERAAAAARRVPSPEPAARKGKGKTVSWRSEEAMVGVRWFLKGDPPAAARHDADATHVARGGGRAQREPSPPRFESAAKKEHLSEAAALRRHRAEEDQERAQLERRLAQMVPGLPWSPPADNDAMSEAALASLPAPPARGEDSLERPAAETRRAAAPVPDAGLLSGCPAEPSTPADRGYSQPIAPQRIPLSLEAAAAAATATQQPAPVPPPPDIGAALAQLAASGLLNGVAGAAAGPEEQQQRPLSQQQPVHVPVHGGPRPGHHQPVIHGGPGPGLGCPAHHQQAMHGGQGPEHHQQAMHGGQGPEHHQPPMHGGPGSGHHQPLGSASGLHHGWHPSSRGGHPGMPPRAPAPPWPDYGGPRVCRYFNTAQGCRYGDRCNFAHPAPSGSKRPAQEGEPWQPGSKRGRS